MGDLERVLIDGEPVEGPAATVPVLDRGLQYGDALFETIACTDGQPRLLGRHLQRLAAGCRRLGIEVGDAAALAHDAQTLARGTSRSIVKLLVTRGAGRARGYALTGGERATRIALRHAWPAEDPASQEQGVRVRLATLRLGENPALAGLKHCNRLEQVQARREWTDPTIADSLLFSSSGALVSGTMSNVFLVRGSKLLTPLIDRCGVLGVMRALVLEIAVAAGIAAEERRLEMTDLETAEELFLTNSVTGIRPVRELEGRQRARGPMTQRLQAELAAQMSLEAERGAAGE